MDDATRILDSGTEDYPLDSSAAGAAEDCPHCSSTIAIGNLFCASCGYQRGTWSADKAAGTAPAQRDRGPAIYEISDTAGNTYALPEGETVLGRGDADLKIADGYLSRRHASFKANADTLTLTDLGSANGSFIGEDRLEQDSPRELQDGQSFKLGRTEFTLRRLDQPAADETLVSPVEETYSDVPVEDSADSGNPVSETESLAEVSVSVASGWSIEQGADVVHEIPLGDTTLGRSSSKSDLQIGGDGYISGLHGKLVATDDGLSYVDLGSTNGSMINAEPLEANNEVQLADGDRLQLGQTEFIVNQNRAADDEIEGNPDEPGIVGGM